MPNPADAADEAADVLPEGCVKVRVLPLGHGRVATGETNVNGKEPDQKFPTYSKGDIFVLQRDIAEVQEAKGLLEIQ